LGPHKELGPVDELGLIEEMGPVGEWGPIEELSPLELGPLVAQVQGLDLLVKSPPPNLLFCFIDMNNSNSEYKEEEKEEWEEELRRKKGGIESVDRLEDVHQISKQSVHKGLRKNILKNLETNGDHSFIHPTDKVSFRGA
jgi:hypothetical protein